MISSSHKTLFVHIPKVAGQSIETMFLNELGLGWDQRGALLLRKKKPTEQGPERLAHLRGRDYVSLGYISQEDFDAYFKFSFVRDPYKRTFSFYNFLGYSRIMSFKSFVQKVLPKKLASDDFFFRSQYDYIFDTNGNCLVDYIGRLEHIKDDIKTVAVKAGIPNASLPHVNKSKGEWHRGLSLLVRNIPYIFTLKFGQRGKSFEQTMNQEIKDKIYSLYQKDFEYLEYSK